MPVRSSSGRPGSRPSCSTRCWHRPRRCSRRSRTRASPTRRRSPQEIACSTSRSRPRSSSGGGARCRRTSAPGPSSRGAEGPCGGGGAADGVRGVAPRPASVTPARRAAYEVLLRVFEDGAYADRALRSATEDLDDRDRALARRLAFGAVQRGRTLDHVIEELGRRPVRRLDPPVRAALRLGGYQLGFLDGVPRYAAVNESVELVRRARLERAVPFTNAVLRRVAEGIRPLLEALPEETPAEAALRHSYPDWVAEAWWRDLGADGARDCMRAQNEPAEKVVRLVRGEIEGVPDRDVPGAWHVERVDEDALAEGRIWPQSQIR